MMDQNWSSQQARDFRRNVDTARSNKAPADDLWGFLLDDDDDSSFEFNEPDVADCEMPGLTISESESNDLHHILPKLSVAFSL